MCRAALRSFCDGSFEDGMLNTDVMRGLWNGVDVTKMPLTCFYGSCRDSPS
jgi:hypothetical protein